jgi:predicted dehydrogenase
MIPDQAIQLHELAEKKNLMCGVAFQNRLNPAIKALHQAIAAGRFGTIVSASVRLHWCRFQDYYEDGWHGTWAMDGGVVNQQAIHHVDALNWLCGPVEMCCAQKTNRLNNLEAEDTMVAALKFESGALGTIEVTSAARPEDFEAVICIVGEKGYVKIGGIALNEVHEWRFVDSISEDKTIPTDCTQQVETGYGISHGPLINKTIERLLEGNTEPVVSALEGKNTAALVHALYKSTETNQWVKLSDKLLSDKLGKLY